MTVAELIERLKNYPQDMSVGIDGDFEYPDGREIEISIHTWVHSNYPYDLPDTEYVNIT